MSLTARQILTDELGALGLKPGATSAAINSAVKAKYSSYPVPPQIDTRTGLPFTQATAADAGSGNLAGVIIGGGLLGYTFGWVIDAATGAATSGALALDSTGAAEGDVLGTTAGARLAGAPEAGAGTTAGGEAATGTSAGGAASTIGSVAKNAAIAGGTAGAISSIWDWLTTASHWVRILEFVGGAVLVYMAVKGLTGIDMPSVTAVASKVVK